MHAEYETVEKSWQEMAKAWLISVTIAKISANTQRQIAGPIKQPIKCNI